MTGDMFRGPHLVTGGTPQETRGILETKREIKDLAARITEERERLFKLAQETAGLQGAGRPASSAMAELQTEHHGHEKTIVARVRPLQRASDNGTRPSP